MWPDMVGLSTIGASGVGEDWSDSHRCKNKASKDGARGRGQEKGSAQRAPSPGSEIVYPTGYIQIREEKPN
jgi:hypothetical protein